MKALITGASSGIGKDIAKVLSSKGYELILVARDKEALDNVAKELSKKYGVKIQTISTDLSNSENCKMLFEQAKDIDLLVNNAGFGDCGYFTKTSLDKELAMIETNITAYHILTKIYLKQMVEKGEGKILNVASIAGFMPGPLMATYYATKNYIVRLSEAIREELKKQDSKVQISILCPGPVKTNFNKVANVKFNLKEADSMKIAKYAIDKLDEGKFYIIPGASIKFARFGAKVTPSNILSKISYKMQKRKLER